MEGARPAPGVQASGGQAPGVQPPLNPRAGDAAVGLLYDASMERHYGPGVGPVCEAVWEVWQGIAAQHAQEPAGAQVEMGCEAGQKVWREWKRALAGHCTSPSWFTPPKALPLPAAMACTR